MNVHARSRSRSGTMLALATALLAQACDDSPPPNTGGTAEGRGLVVIDSDYQATNVSLVGFDGKVLSSSFFSSSSPTLHPESPASALSGDVVQPTMPQQGPRVVLIDRHFGVLSWVEIASGKLLSQLPIGPKVPLNLQDYLEVSPHKAYVPTLDPRLDPSLGPVEKGSNVVIIDPAAPAITGVIDLRPALSGDEAKLYPRPTRAVLVGQRAYVLLAPATQYFDQTAVSRIVTLDTETDAIVAVTPLPGLHNCTGLGLSPSGKRLAVSCSGTFHTSAAGQRSAKLDESGLIVLTRSDDALAEEKRWWAKDFGESPLGFSVSFASEDQVTFATFGQLGDDGKPVRDDAFMTLDLTSGKSAVPLRATDAFVIGETRCLPEAALCFVPEAGPGGGALHRFTLKDGALSGDQSIEVDPAIGLPPRYLGQF